MKHIPNILTSIRIAAAGVFAYFFAQDNHDACVYTFALSMLTDVLDGAIARKFNCISDLGKILDPLADKLTLLVISICFFSSGLIPKYMLIAIIVKESLMLIGAVIMLRHKAVAYSDAFGKAATTLFSTSIILALLRGYSAFSFLGDLYVPVFGLSIICSFVALFHYANTQFRQNVHQQQQQ